MNPILKREQGQGLTAYALVLLLVAIVVVAVVAMFGTRLGMTFQGINCEVALYPQVDGPLTIVSVNRVDNDTVRMRFNLALAEEITFYDLQTGFTETFSLSSGSYSWITDDTSGNGYSGPRAGTVSARSSGGSFVCGKYAAFP